MRKLRFFGNLLKSFKTSKLIWGKLTSVVCMWKTGFSLNDGAKEKEHFILACETVSRCCLACCGCKGSRSRERNDFDFSLQVCFYHSVCRCLIFSDSIALWLILWQSFSFVGEEISLGCRKAKPHGNILKSVTYPYEKRSYVSFLW